MLRTLKPDEWKRWTVTRPWTSIAELQPDASLGKKVKQALRPLLWGCRHLGDGSRYTNLLFSLVVCAPDMDHVARLVNCRLHFKGRAPNREVFVEVRAPGASESHQDETSPLNWRQSSSAPKVPEVGVTGKNDIWNQSVRFSFIFCLSTLLILFRCKGLSFCFPLSHTHIDRIFCQLMLIQVLFGYETCNVQVVFYVAGSYLTPEKR